MDINLTLIERQILVNQNKLLSLLDEENEKKYDLNIEILQRGFELEYDSVVNVYPEDQVTTHAICKETVDILQMYRIIYNSIASLSPEHKEQLNLEKIKFEGFDANNDSHYAYAEFMIEKQNKWDEHKDLYLNSHSTFPLSKYRRMLTAMNERLTDMKFDLDKEDLEYIINMV